MPYAIKQMRNAYCRGQQLKARADLAHIKAAVIDLSSSDVDQTASDVHSSTDDDDPVPEAPTLTVEEKQKQCSRELLELLGSNDVQETHILKVLAIVDRYTENNIVPTSVYKLKQKAL